MSCSTGIGLIACLVLLTITVRGQVPGPNAVTVINGQTMLDCTTINFGGSNWQHTPDGTSASVTIASGCIISAGNFAAYYRTEPGINTCRLIIANVTMQQAGVYNCYDGTATVYRSLVTVIDPVASIVVHNRSEVVDGDKLNISCSINYNGPQLPAPSQHPLPYWTTSSPGQIFTNATFQLSTNVSTVIATVTVQKYTVPIFQCYTVFEINGTEIKYNLTAPADSFAVGSTKEIDVQYPVENIITNSTVPHPENCISRPETLTCSANANPPAQYKWHDLKNNITTSGPDKSISSDGEFQCIASNSIRNQPYNETKNEIVTSCYPAQNLTINGTNCENNFCTCNGNDSNSKQISIICMANGIPIPSVKWRSDNLFDGLYETIGVSLNGNYTCVAFNTYGGNNYSEELTVFVSGCLDPFSITSEPPSLNVTTTAKPKVSNTPIIIGIVIGVIVILNVVATGLFFWYYQRVEVSQRNNKLKLDRRFPWLKKMMPCVSDTKESAGSNCLWVSLFILLGIVTGIVTFPIWIMLAKKYEKNNETSALNRRENGEGNGSGENGVRPTNSSANHNQPPPTNQMNAIRQEGPYQNDSSRENIELNNSLRSRNLLLPDFQPPRPQPAGRPPPPPNKPTMNLSTNRSKDYTVNDQTQAANPEHTTYADLPFVPRNTLPTATPVQFLNVSNDTDTYASLNKT